MAGYTRQSVADIINGAEITAPPLNAEFNQLTAAFNAVSGHTHDGSTGNAPKIDLTTSVSGYLPAINGGVGGRNNLTAISTPTATDDLTLGYAPGSIWENTTTGRVYICIGNTLAAATWRELVQVVNTNAILPHTHDVVDLGDVGTRFQDLYLSGGVSASGTAAFGGNLVVVGSTTLSSTLAVNGVASLPNVAVTGGTIDGTVIGGSTRAAGSFTTVTASGLSTLSTVDINGGAIDGTTIGGSTPAAGTFTTLAATSISGPVTGNVTGNLTGNVTGSVTGNLTGNVTSIGLSTFATADINGGTIDGTTIGATTPAAVTGTTITANTGFVGPLAGNVVGNVSGNLTGNVTGNVTATVGTTTLNNLTVNGTADFTNTALANVSSPVLGSDAANKDYVDTQISNLIAAAPGTLDTLNEIAAAIGDDPNFASTITASIATKLPLAGGTMSGNIAMGGSRVTGLADPATGTDAVNLQYMESVTGTLTAAADSADLAGRYATEAVDVNVEAGTYSAFHWATKSSDSATASASSASAASTSEANAAASEAASASSQTAAAGSASAAATSETNSAASAAAAAISEGNAATSASSAASSATAASTSAGNASTSETNAAASASAASTSETNAASYRDTAQAAATAAAGSEAAAAAYLTDINNTIPTIVTKTYVDNLNVDADTLDGLNSTDFDPAGTALALAIALG